MAVQRVPPLRHAEVIDVLGRRHGRLGQTGDTARNQVALLRLTGGPECQAVDRIWAALDKTHAKHPDMVLLHGGSPKGAERIAAACADNRKVPQIVFEPDWTRHSKAAPFKRNDQMLEALPRGSSFSRASASPPISPPRHGGSASRSGSSSKAPLKRRCFVRRIGAAQPIPRGGN